LAIGHLLFSSGERRTTDTSACVSYQELAETGEGVVYARNQGVVSYATLLNREEPSWLQILDFRCHSM
jgi:hypothetical protein